MKNFDFDSPTIPSMMLNVPARPSKPLPATSNESMPPRWASELVAIRASFRSFPCQRNRGGSRYIVPMG